MNNRDDVVLWLVLIFCFITPVVLASLWAFSGRFYPPMLLAVLLGIGVAALTYRYLGGTSGSEFSVGVLKVAGSAALLLGTTYITNQGFSSQMDADNSANKLMQVRKDRDRAIHDINSLQKKLDSATEQLEKTANQSVEESIFYAEKLSPTSVLGSKLVEMSRKRQGPFSAVQKFLTINVTATDATKDEGSFNACSDLALAGEDVRLTVEVGDEAVPVLAKQSGIIESIICNRSGRRFDLQVSCKAGLKLFPEQILGCGEKGQVKWATPNGHRVFSVGLEVLSRL